MREEGRSGSVATAGTATVCARLLRGGTGRDYRTASGPRHHLRRAVGTSGGGARATPRGVRGVDVGGRSIPYRTPKDPSEHPSRGTGADTRGPLDTRQEPPGARTNDDSAHLPLDEAGVDDSASVGRPESPGYGLQPPVE